MKIKYNLEKKTFLNKPGIYQLDIKEIKFDGKKINVLLKESKNESIPSRLLF